jgi:hypothetical protein
VVAAHLQMKLPIGAELSLAKYSLNALFILISINDFIIIQLFSSKIGFPRHILKVSLVSCFMSSGMQCRRVACVLFSKHLLKHNKLYNKFFHSIDYTLLWI